VASSGVWPSETAQGHPLSSIIWRSLGRKVWGVSGSDRYVSATLRDAMTPSVSGQNPLPGNAGEYGAWSVCRVTDVSHRAGWLAESLADSEQSAALSLVSELPRRLRGTAPRACFRLGPAA
jgi:hypothetical protein